jgi:carbon storage regulator
MLILTRRPGESVMIGRDVVVTVLWSKVGMVRFGITAPKAISIDREEIFERKLRDQHAAKNGDASLTPGAIPGPA